MERDIADDIDEIDSFDAYYAAVWYDNTNLVIPYINLGFSKHPLNPRNDRLLYLDYGYLVCLNVDYLKVESGVLVNKHTSLDRIFHFGGLQLDGPPDLIAFEIGCELAYIQTLPDSRLSESIWVAVDSPLRNLDQTQVDAFFRGERMPHKIQQIVEAMSF